MRGLGFDGFKGFKNLGFRGLRGLGFSVQGLGFRSFLLRVSV